VNSAEEERLRHGSSFGAAAAAYAEHRPDYAEAAVRWALEPVGQPTRVVDLGAGTGKLTAALARLGAEVTAVEPDPAMRAELRRILPEVRTLAGRAEEIPVPDGSADAVLAGQAMHWFDMDKALPEITRVLAPGGVLAGLWNVDDDRVGWVAALAAVSQGQASMSRTRWHARVGTALALPGTVGRDLFSTAEVAEFEHGQRRTADSLVATIATHSALLVMNDPERIVLLAQVRDYLNSVPETGSGTEFTLPMITIAVRSIRG
jgi:SAM-dependent methyltransferase